VKQSDRPIGATADAANARRNNSAGGGPPTVASYVTGQLRSGILEGHYPAGSRLDQEMVAEEFGASIIPVRESLRQLEAEGLVRITPRRGAFIVELTGPEVMEIYKIRAALEGLATKEAVPRLTLDDLNELQAVNDELVRLAHSNSGEMWTRVNHEWHYKLYEAAESPLLLQFIGTMWDRCTVMSHTYVRDPVHRVRSAADHSRVLKAARKGDADLAAQVVAEHILKAMRELVGSGVANRQASASGAEPSGN
jgi:DNA-binding GntR family transcriptional regulator